MGINKQKKDIPPLIPPRKVYRLNGAAESFGFAASTIYDMCNSGVLVRWSHHLKIGTKTLIVPDEFIAWMKEQDGRQE